MKIVIDEQTKNDISPERKMEIADTALSVFSPYAPVDKSNLHKLPVIEILKRHNVVVVPYSVINQEQLAALRTVSKDFTEYGMFYQNEGGQSFIYYNDQKSQGICDLTLFHELGHLFLKHSQRSNFAEREADFFAAFCLGYIRLLKELKKEVA